MAGIKPYSLQGVRQNPLARMLPLQREQMQVYRLGEKNPPSELKGYGPTWEVVNLVLNARATLQARVNLQRDFHLLAVLTSATSVVNGGFRAQFYDVRKKLRLADRGVQQAQLGGGANSPAFLREPYRFDLPDSQVLVIAQNLETVTNTIQIVLFGFARRFNEPGYFPGGNVPSQGVQP